MNYIMTYLLKIAFPWGKNELWVIWAKFPVKVFKLLLVLSPPKGIAVNSAFPWLQIWHNNPGGAKCRRKERRPSYLCHHYGFWYIPSIQNSALCALELTLITRTLMTSHTVFWLFSHLPIWNLMTSWQLLAIWVSIHDSKTERAKRKV